MTTAGNKSLFERLTKAPIEIVKGSRAFTSPQRTVELHDIGPSPHANEMLVAWLPAEGILFQADLIDDAVFRRILEQPVVPPSQSSASQDR